MLDYAGYIFLLIQYSHTTTNQVNLKLQQNFQFVHKFQSQSLFQFPIQISKFQSEIPNPNPNPQSSILIPSPQSISQYWNSQSKFVIPHPNLNS